MRTEFWHVRDKTKSTGGVTYAFHSNDEGVCRIAAAHCHPKDNFCRHIGRVKAEGRLNSPHYSTVFFPPVTKEEAIKHIAPVVHKL